MTVGEVRVLDKWLRKAHERVCLVTRREESGLCYN